MENGRQVRWKEVHRVSTYDVDCTNRLKISSIFNLMQEAASNSADHLGWGYDDMIKEGLFWVLSRTKLSVVNQKRFGEELIIETWPKKIEGLFAVRDFKIFDSKQNPVCTATTCWLLIDGSTIRPIKTAELLKRFVYRDPDSTIQEIPGKIIELDSKELAYEKLMRYTDIDVNQHVNNVRLVEAILDCFSIEQYKGRQIISIQVNYLDELKYGDVLRVYKGKIGGNEDISYIDGINQRDKRIFQALVEWGS